MEEFVEYFYSFNFAEDLVVNDEDEEDIRHSNGNNESEINENNQETVILDDPITNETNHVTVVTIDWFMIFITLLYLIYDVLWYLLKKSNNGYSQM